MDEFNKIINLFSKNYLNGEDEKYLDSVDFNKYHREIVNIKNPRIFDKIIKYMEGKYYLDEINNKRKEYIKKILFNQKDEKLLDLFLNVTQDNYKSLNLFTFYELRDIKIYSYKFNEAIEMISNRWIKEYIISYFFGENYYNFLVNFNNMNRYMDSVKELLIDEDHIKFYYECCNIDSKPLKEIIDFFKKNSLKENIHEMFYDDMRKVKNHSYQNLVNKSLDLSKNEFLYSPSLSNEYKAQVYYLNGERFYAFIRYINSDSFDDDYDKYDRYVNSNLDKDYYSFSYIGNNIGSIGTGGDGYYLLYSHINPNNITHVSHMDSSSSRASTEKYFKSDRVNEIHTPTSLIYDTDSYNEIVIKKDSDGIKPSALVCFDKIREKDLIFSDRYHLPILLINSKKYYRSTRYTNYDEIDTYSL